jgi:hypothetical protein
MPRAGNTLLGSIINQNPRFNLTANSITVGIIYNIHQLKSTEVFKNFPDEKSLNNVIKNIFNNYYENWNANIILDRASWGTSTNLFLLKSIIAKPKFIILYRPVMECLASLIKNEINVDVEKRCHEIMSINGIIGKNLYSIKNIIKEKENYIIINYSDLINKPLDEIIKIYNFLNINIFNHYFENLDQFSVNNIKYDDSIYNKPLHTIKSKKLELNNYKIEDYLPSSIIEEYSNLDI